MCSPGRSDRNHVLMSCVVCIQQINDVVGQNYALKRRRHFIHIYAFIHRNW